MRSGSRIRRSKSSISRRNAESGRDRREPGQPEQLCSRRARRIERRDRRIQNARAGVLLGRGDHRLVAARQEQPEHLAVDRELALEPAIAPVGVRLLALSDLVVAALLEHRELRLQLALLALQALVLGHVRRQVDVAPPGVRRADARGQARDRLLEPTHLGVRRGVLQTRGLEVRRFLRELLLQAGARGGFLRVPLLVRPSGRDLGEPLRGGDEVDPRVADLVLELGERRTPPSRRRWPRTSGGSGPGRSGRSRPAPFRRSDCAARRSAG